MSGPLRILVIFPNFRIRKKERKKREGEEMKKEREFANIFITLFLIKNSLSNIPK